MSRFDKEAKDWDTPEKQDRARKIADVISAQVLLNTEMSALEYGCGTGQLSFELRQKIGPITLADNSTGMLDVLRDKIEAESAEDMKPVKLDLISDPLPDVQYDLIYTLLTLHHIPDTQLILSKFHKLLNPGGYLCIADLNKEDGSFHDHDFEDIHKGFDRDELAHLAEKMGFNKVQFQTAYQIEKEVEGADKPKEFPVFLMVARKM